MHAREAEAMNLRDALSWTRAEPEKYISPKLVSKNFLSQSHMLLDFVVNYS